MASFFQRPVVRRIRTLFRWCRITVWLILLLTISSLAYLHMVGLPDFLKKPLLQRLLASDIAADFSNMQLGWKRGPSVIIENVSFRRANQTLSPRLSASRAELALDWAALRRARLHARTLDVMDAQWRLPVAEPAGDALVLDHLTLGLQFGDNDSVRVNTCRGVFRGMQLDIIGRVVHVKGLRQWIYPSAGGQSNELFQTRVQQISRMAHQIHFSGTPVLQIEAGGDGDDINSFHAEMTLAVNSAETPWGQVTNLNLSAACARLIEPGRSPFCEIAGAAADVATRWGSGRNIAFDSSWTRGPQSNIIAAVKLNTADFHVPLQQEGKTIRGRDLFWDGRLTFSPTNVLFRGAQGKLRVHGAESPWIRAEEIALDSTLTRVAAPTATNADLGMWAKAFPWKLQADVTARNIAHPKLRANRLSCTVDWEAPRVSIEKLNAALYDGTAEIQGVLDVNTRDLECSGTGNFNPHNVAPLLRPQEQRFLAQLDWAKPPAVKATLRVTLPAWVGRPTNWIRLMDASLRINGDFVVGQSSFNSVPMQSATGHYAFDGKDWHVSPLHATRADGAVDLDYQTVAGGFHYIVDGRMEPKAALPIVAPGQPHLLDDFSFTEPPHIVAEIHGSWRDPDALTVRASGTASNFTFRGEQVGLLTASAVFGNQVLRLSDVEISNALAHARIGWLEEDVNARRVRLTNATGTVDPKLLERLLQKQVPSWLNEIRFDVPPELTVSGSFVLTNPQATDLHFVMHGQNVHYTNLMADRASALLDWTGNTVRVTNVVASLYAGGSLHGWILFPSTPNGPNFQADFTARDIDLAALFRGLNGRTNHLEGKLDGDLSLVGPNGIDRFDWQGSGRVHVHNALLWDIKIFGLLSPVLNLISPGWGHDRARESAADFVITNGGISTDDLEVRFQGFRLFVRGSVDKQRHINARLEAVLSKSIPVLGSVLSLAFTPLSKLFEYRITGPVNDPAMEPVYVPKFILIMLHPFHALKEHSESAPDGASPPGK
jgi:hypothetical protein